MVIFLEFCSMPLLTIKDVGKSGKLGLWHITEPISELMSLRKFSGEEAIILAGFSHEHRKKQWLVARILIEKLSGEKGTSIIYDQFNKPSLKDSRFHISISHSHDLLVIIYNASETGIDIELVKPKVVSIKEKFMSASELRALEEDCLPEQLTVHWCVKEALYKLYGKKELTFKENLIVEPFLYSEKGQIRGWIKNSVMQKCFNLQYEKLVLGTDNYAMAYVNGQD